MSAPREALIIGGGPAGAAMGILLARSGREVTLAQKSSGAHDKVCGEFLSGEAVQYLAQLGMDLRTLGAAPVYGVRLARRNRIAECELPFAAMSLSRRSLDEALLTMAAREGVEVRRGTRVDALERNGATTRRALLASGESLLARSVILATGKHDLCGWRRPPGKQNDLVALKMNFALTDAQQRALRGWIELCLFPGGYAGMQLNEDHEANLCLLVNRTTLRKYGNDWHTLLPRVLGFSEHLAERLAGAKPLLDRPLALSSIPYGMLLRHAEPDLWRLGDQEAVTPSFSGDGMSIALHSAEVAAELYVAGGSPAELATRLHKELRRSIGIATAVSRLIIAAPALANIVRACPALLSALANRTRVPDAALVV